MSVNLDAHRTRFRDISGRTTLAAGDNLSVTPRQLVAGKAGHTIFVQKASFNVITDNAATQTLQDDNGTPRVIAKTKASPGIGPINFDFGEEGVALTEGKDLELANSGAGLAAEITWTGYMKMTGVMTAADFAAV